MVQLETVEDFENVKKALDNPRSSYGQFCVKNFGYCTACKTLTPYEGSYSLEGCSETCLRCKRVFEQGSEAVNHRMRCFGFFYYSDREFIPDEFRQRFDELTSRKFQKKVFNERLERVIKREKGRERRVKANIRRLAKLRN